MRHARPEDCATCPVRSRCLSQSTTSRRYLSVPVDTQPPNLIDAMKAKIDSEEGKRIYGRRLGIVELVVEPVETRFSPTSVSTSACTVLPFVPNRKWMYNGRVRGLLWFTISARSTPLERSADP